MKALLWALGCVVASLLTALALSAQSERPRCFRVLVAPPKTVLPVFNGAVIADSLVNTSRDTLIVVLTPATKIGWFCPKGTTAADTLPLEQPARLPRAGS